ncbi:MAG: hypothetical protein ACI4CY_05420 [Candidatus Gastranaerophilaceae bacterium]
MSLILSFVFSPIKSNKSPKNPLSFSTIVAMSFKNPHVPHTKVAGRSFQNSPRWLMGFSFSTFLNSSGFYLSDFFYAAPLLP